MLARKAVKGLDRLSGREKEVAEFVFQGKTNKEIAELLGVKEHTVKTYVSRIYRKLHVNTRRQIAGALSGAQGEGGPHVVTLTQREKEVADLLTLGASNQQIAHLLGISENTVKMHVTHIFAKLEVRNRTKAAFLLRKLFKL